MPHVLTSMRDSITITAIRFAPRETPRHGEVVLRRWEMRKRRARGPREVERSVAKGVRVLFLGRKR